MPDDPPMNGSQPQAYIFFQPENLGALPALWLQAKLTISLTSHQDKFAKLFMTIAAELCCEDVSRPRGSLSGCCQKLHSACRN
jgi:hypothetical protein